MQFAILIYESRADLGTRREGGAPQQAVAAAYRQYTRALVEAGVMRAGEALALPEQAATIVPGDGGVPRVQDGPYADTKDLLGGFFVIDVPSLDEAIAWAARCPAARTGAVEVRPTVPPPAGEED